MGDNAADFTLALALTILAGLVTFLWWRRSGATSTLLTGVGITMLPLALWLTRTLRLLSSIVDDIGNWATGLVFSPRVWVGLVIAVIAVLLIGGGLALRRRQSPDQSSDQHKGPRPAKGAKGIQAAPAKKAGGDTEMDEIEALLRDRGIS